MLKHFIVAGALMAMSNFSLAHDATKGAHGGQVVDDAGHHIEFSATGDQIALYLTDGADKPLSSTKATGRIIILAGSNQSTAELAPMEPDMLMARLAAPLPSGAKLAVSVKLSDGHDVKARFVAP